MFHFQKILNNKQKIKEKIRTIYFVRSFLGKLGFLFCSPLLFHIFKPMKGNYEFIRLAQSPLSTLLSRSLKEIKHHQNTLCRSRVSEWKMKGEFKRKKKREEKNATCFLFISSDEIIIITLFLTRWSSLCKFLHFFFIAFVIMLFRFKFNQRKFSPCLLIFPLLTEIQFFQRLKW